MTKIASVAVLGLVLSAVPSLATAQADPADGTVQAYQADTTTKTSDSPSFTSPGLGATFKSVGGDLRHMLSRDNLGVAALFGSSAIAATHWDGAAVEEVREMPSGLFRAGNNIGALWTALGAGFGTFAIGKATNSAPIATLGSHIIRAQIASQLVVQGLKFASERSRPDATNHFSFPSGHTASAFAAATVLQRDFGWKVGIPAYAVGGYVAAARMQSNKHYLSDVIIGAAIGVSAGRAVTVGSGRMRFDVGVAPTNGGAALMFTKRD